MNKSQKELLMYCAVAFVIGYLVCMYFKPKKFEMFDNADIPRIYRIPHYQYPRNAGSIETYDIKRCTIDEWDEVENGKSCRDYLLDIIRERGSEEIYELEDKDSNRIGNENEVFDAQRIQEILESDEMCNQLFEGVRSICAVKGECNPDYEPGCRSSNNSNNNNNNNNKNSDTPRRRGSH